jgi:hypothetical protein
MCQVVERGGPLTWHIQASSSLFGKRSSCSNLGKLIRYRGVLDVIVFFFLGLRHRGHRQKKEVVLPCGSWRGYGGVAFKKQASAMVRMEDKTMKCRLGAGAK